MCPNPKHHNPQNGCATAPYNFVPLPENVVTVSPIPDHDIYSHNSGYIECSLTTSSPLYIRGGMSPNSFKKIGDKKFNELSKSQKDERARFFHIEDENMPVIPGSSIRGMVRTLVEVVGSGKMHWVTENEKITYRAVAGDEPLSSSYSTVMGKYGTAVMVGYLERKGNEWFVHPAKKFSSSTPFIKIKDAIVAKSRISGFIGFNDKQYKPQYHDVSFDLLKDDDIYDHRRIKTIKVSRIGPHNAGYTYRGVMICSGNMLETNTVGNSPRRNHSLIHERNPEANKLRINPQAIANYIGGLNDFQKQSPFDEHYGCLVEGKPIFYVENAGEVQFFGHCPNFRIPALNSKKDIVSPYNFVPHDLHPDDEIDIAEAIFGFEQNKKYKSGYAGRVFFTDALLQSGVKDTKEPVRIMLSSPKPTTFQHYLVQDRDKKHDPDVLNQLAHYSTASPDETVIRGFKFYWHKNEVDLGDTKAKDTKNTNDMSKMSTLVKPIGKGVTFNFRIYYDNLREFELGALLWVLKLSNDSLYRHNLGMGKPLGMGAVKIEPKLFICNRMERYNRLFDVDKWALAVKEEPSIQKYIDGFENEVLDHIPPEEKGTAQKLENVQRIKMLLKMLEWPGPDPEKTRYLKIEPNEYNGRPVLPDPLNIGIYKARENEHTGRKPFHNNQQDNKTRKRYL